VAAHANQRHHLVVSQIVAKKKDAHLAQRSPAGGEPVLPHGQTAKVCLKDFFRFVLFLLFFISLLTNFVLKKKLENFNFSTPF
jgi:hypothetical protein